MTTAPPPGAELDDETYDLFRSLVLERTGILFGPMRRNELSRGVLAAAARACPADLVEYASRLGTARTDSSLWDDLIAEISIGESYFFRDEAQMAVLRQQILPALIARHRGDRTLRIWCAGCSTGEEPYSLAMILPELLHNKEIESWNLLILATDINRRALEKAAEGSYRDWSFRATDPRVRDRFFVAKGACFELRPEIRRMVTFGYLNLASGAYPSLVTQTVALDLILWRNVAIYLPEQVVRSVVPRLHDCLVPGGYLMVAAAEADTVTYERFATLSFAGATLYQKSPTEPAQQEAARLAQPEPERPPIRPAPHPVVPVDPQKQYRKGLEWLHEGKLDEAVEAFGSCVASQPAFAPAHHALARIQANRGDLGEARKRCERAIQCDPRLPEAHYTLALICVEEGGPGEAVTCLKKTLYLEPGFALAHFSLATLLARAGHSAAAGRHRREALRIAAALPPDELVTGSDDLSGGELRAMLARAAVGLEAGGNRG